MKKIIYFVFYFWGLSDLLAQQNDKLQFFNFKPKWEHFSVAPELPDTTYLYEPYRRAPLLIDNDLYLLSNIDNRNNEGYLLEKLDVNTGVKKWSKHYFNATPNQRKFAYSLEPNNNKIDLLIYKENKRYYQAGENYWWESNFGMDSYCMDTGDLCDSIVTNPKDSMNITTQMVDIGNGSYGNSGFFNNGDNFFYVEHYYDGKSPKYVEYFNVHTIDKRGYHLDSFSVAIRCKYPPDRVNMFEYRPNRYMAMIYCENSTGAKYQTLLVYFDEHFKLEKTYDVSSSFTVPAGRTYIQSITKDNLVACRYIDQRVKVDSFATLYHFVAFNHDGERLDYGTVRVGTNDNCKAVVVTPANKLLIRAIRREPNKHRFEFYNTMADGVSQLFKTINMNRTVNLYELYNIGKNQILMYFIYPDSSKKATKYYASATHWMMVPLESLGFPLPTKDIDQAAFGFYPNPANQQIHIETNLDYDAVNVYSIDGRLLQSVENQGNTIDVAALPSGLYFFDLWQQGKAVTRKEKFVKVE